MAGKNGSQVALSKELEDHERRVRFVRELVAKVAISKHEANAYGTFEIKMDWKDGLLMKVDVTDRTVYK
jgi:hypothetical protein